MSGVDRHDTPRGRIGRFVHARWHEDSADARGADPWRAGRREAHDPFIRLERVSKTFGSGPDAVEALAALDLEVGVGEFLAVTGPRGAGKTTLIDLIGAARRPSSGTVLVAGRRIDLLDDRGRLDFRTAHVALAPQTPTLAPTLTVYETLLHVARTSRNRPSEEWTETLLDAFELHKHAAVRAAHLTNERQQRLSVARAVAKDAPLLLLDEALAAASVATRRRSLAQIRRVARRDATVVLATREPDVVPSPDQMVQL